MSGPCGASPLARLTRTRGAFVMCVALSASAAPAAHAQTGPNPDARLVLHAIAFEDGHTCLTPQIRGYDDCATETVTMVTASVETLIYVYLEGYTDACGVQFGFAWHPSWTMLGWNGLCLTGQIDAEIPGATGGNYSNQFEQQTRGELVALGRLHMVAGNAGTLLDIVEHTSELTGVADCLGVVLDEVTVARRGAIGAGIPGRNPCDSTPVAATSWGAIKSQYR